MANGSSLSKLRVSARGGPPSSAPLRQTRSALISLGSERTGCDTGAPPACAIDNSCCRSSASQSPLWAAAAPSGSADGTRVRPPSGLADGAGVRDEHLRLDGNMKMWEGPGRLLEGSHADSGGLQKLPCPRSPSSCRTREETHGNMTEVSLAWHSAVACRISPVV